MIITQAKPLQEVLESLRGYDTIFLVGCGECSTTCKTGGEDQLTEMTRVLESRGKTVVGRCLPKAPCVSSQIKKELAKGHAALSGSDAVLVMACGLGVQATAEADRSHHPTIPALDTLCGAVVDSAGNFEERCSLCGECVLADTGGICPVTLCAKGLLNGPCGGMNRGMCEVDRNRECTWVLIYKELERQNKVAILQRRRDARDHQKAARPHTITLPR